MIKTFCSFFIIKSRTSANITIVAGKKVKGNKQTRIIEMEIKPLKSAATYKSATKYSTGKLKSIQSILMINKFFTHSDMLYNLSKGNPSFTYILSFLF